MQSEKNISSEENLREENAAYRSTAANDPAPLKEENRFVAGIKKVGFSVWLGVMIIGGALAFITALFLV